MRRVTVTWTTIAIAGLAATLIAAVAWVGAARADFTVALCQGGAPAAPWTLGLAAVGSTPPTPGFAGTLDRCASAGRFGLLLPDDAQSAGELEGARIEIPSDEALSHVALDYHAVPDANGGQDFYGIGYGADGAAPTFLVYAQGGDNSAGTHIDSPVPDASAFEVSLFCTNAPGCAYGTQEVFDVGAMSLTLHDTAAPTVQATGGDLLHSGTVRGRQSLTYGAASAGSGVARVTVGLGQTVLADMSSACQPSSLRPCPPSVSGVATVDTGGVADGAYPVVLTAYDASGDPVATQVSRVVVGNHSGTQTLLTPGPKRLRVRLELGRRWTRSRTTLTSLAVHRLPRRARLTISCAGRRCPFARRATDRRHLTAFRHRLVGTRFRPGEHLTVTVSQRHRRTERARLRVERDRQPRAVRSR